MSYDPAVIANAVLLRAAEAGIPVDHMKLQKLVFFTHAWHLALHGQPASAEAPEAWQYGPVFGSLYHRLKQHKAKAITEYVKTVDPSTGGFAPLVPSQKDASFWEVLDQVMDRYGRFTALQLSTLTHEPDSPWDKTRRAKLALIPDEAIRDHYQGKLAAAHAN